MNNTSLDSITNKLLLKYDDNFNKSYDKILDIDSSIMNKEELIIKINDEIDKKTNNINILKYLVFLFILLSIILILNSLNIITIGIVLLLSFVLIIIFAVIIYYNIYTTFNINNFSKTLKNIKVEMNEYTGLIRGIRAKPYTCPSTCKTNSTVAPNPALVQSYKQPTLNTNPQTDVWKYGDVPVDLYTTKKYNPKNFYNSPENIPIYRNTFAEEIEDAPKPYFGSSYPKSTYYKCKWLGGDNGSANLPNSENKMYSTIPCSYRPNFTEINRYICTSDPNDQLTDMNSVCEDVSLGLHDEE